MRDAASGEDLSQRLRTLLGYAVLAPSRHNTQPWLFEIEGREARVYADPRRALRRADAEGREMVVACAAALENLRVAARHAGHAASVEVLASRPGGIVGRLSLEEPRPAGPAEEALFDAIPRRHTNRFAFEERALPAGLVAALAREAADGGAALRVVEASARRAVAGLVAEADRAQWADAGYRAELAAWTRSAGSRAPDGVPGYARGLGSAASLLDAVLRRLSPGDAPDERRDLQYVLHTPVLLALCTPGDAPRDWAHAGIAFERVLLRAAAAGLAASYFSSVVEIAPVRRRLREILGETGFPQVVFRVGYGTGVRPTPRRRPEAVLRAFRAGPPASTAIERRR